MNFKKDDRVICIKEFEGNKDIIGVAGTIISLNSDGYDCAVEFDRKIKEGHTCGGTVKLSRGWYISFDCLSFFGKYRRQDLVLIEGKKALVVDTDTDGVYIDVGHTYYENDKITLIGREVLI